MTFKAQPKSKEASAICGKPVDDIETCIKKFGHSGACDCVEASFIWLGGYTLCSKCEQKACFWAHNGEEYPYCANEKCEQYGKDLPSREVAAAKAEAMAKAKHARSETDARGLNPCLSWCDRTHNPSAECSCSVEAIAKRARSETDTLVEAVRHDGGKARYDLIPAFPLFELAEVLRLGAEKYSERNWEKGMNWSRCFGSLMRHAWAYWLGEDRDKESGLHHMAHVACNAFFLLEYAYRGTGKDDRPCPKSTQ